VITRDVTGVSVPDGSGLVTIGVPNRWSAAVDVDGAFDLIRGGSGSPKEIRWERAWRTLVGGVGRAHGVDVSC
jgi:hypothetical protein